MDPSYYALSLYRKRKVDLAIEQCSSLLEKNPYDQMVWYIKTQAMVKKNWVDDSELEEDGVAEVLLDDNALATCPRPGTSLARPLSRADGIQGIRPVSSSGRVVTGFIRPSSARPVTNSVEAAFSGSRPGTSRPVTASGRFVRMGTASMRPETGGPFINTEKMDLRKYTQRPAIAKALCDFILYHDHNPKKALELCSEATTANNFKDWWWKARLGKCYYQLGLYRDAEKQFKSSLQQQDMVTVTLELSKVYVRLDQPLTALELLEKATKRHPGDPHLLLAIARIYEMLNDITHSIATYKRVLVLDAANVESIACIAANLFYEDHPEVALRLNRRLVQMGVSNAELWNNMGLCCFYASQYDLTLSCFERALTQSSDESMADIWYNFGQVAIGIGDLGLAYQAFKIASSIDGNHAESYNNLGVLELRKGNVELAKSHFHTAARLCPFLHESLFNISLLAFKLGDFQESFQMCQKALEIYPEHTESLELKKQLKQQFTNL